MNCRLPICDEGERIMRKARSVFLKIATVLFALIGIAAFVYPPIANHYIENEFQKTIDGYNSQVESLSKRKINDKKSSVEKYNDTLLNPVVDGKIDNSAVFQNGEIIGYVDIPKINEKIPIYEGTDEGVLSKGVGHVKSTSLPCGGKGTHSAIAGHSGLGTAEIFSSLDELENGDTFYIGFLDDVLRYEVVEKTILMPVEADKYIKIEGGEDYCTLITCYPVTVNTHRLLVKGKRIKENKKKTESVRKIIEPKKTRESQEDIPLMIYVAAAILIIVLFNIVIYIITKRRKGKHD